MEARAEKIGWLLLAMLFFSLQVSGQKWEKVNDFEITRRMGAVAFSWQDRGYVGFGHDYNAAYPFNDIDYYDPVSGAWEEVTYLDGGFRTWPFAFVLNDKLYVGGGTKDSAKTALQDFHCYDLRQKKWQRLGDLPFQYAIGARAVVSAGKAYLAGGCTSSGCEPKLWSYDPAADNWQSLKSLPHQSSFGIAFVLNGELYYGLGNGEKEIDYSDIWKTAPADTGGWQRVSTFTRTGRTMAVGIAIDSMHAVAGMGFKMNQYLAQYKGPYYNGYRFGYISPESDYMSGDLWLYSAVTGRWTSLPSQKKGRRGAICFVAGNYLYVGMGNAENRITKDVYRLDLGRVKRR